MTNCSMRKPPDQRRYKQSLPPFVTFPKLEEEIRKFRCMKMVRIVQLLHLFNMKGQMFIQFVILDP